MFYLPTFHAGQKLLLFYSLKFWQETLPPAIFLDVISRMW